MVAALIVGMTFQASINPPGGVWQDNSATHEAGTPIMASTDPETYNEFVVANMVAFILSVLTILWLSIPSPVPEPKLPTWMVIFTGYHLSLAFFTSSFIKSIKLLNPPTKDRSLITAALTSFFGFLGLIPYFRYGPHMVSYFCNYVRAWRQSFVITSN